jgi:hypothetical protein
MACQRCFETFETEDAMKKHSRRDPPCPISSSSPEEYQGIDKDKATQLRSRKYPRNQTAEERWIAIYKILVPDDEESSFPEPCEYWIINVFKDFS